MVEKMGGLMTMSSIEKIIDDTECETEELEEIVSILTGISENVCPSVSVCDKGSYLLFGESIKSAENTIRSIDFCCQRGYFADAFTLARKYRDDVIQYIFIAQVINNMLNVSEEDVKKYCGESLSVEGLIQLVENKLKILREGTNKTDTEIAVELWRYGILENKEYYKERKKFFDTSKYISILKEDVRVKNLMEKYLQGIWDGTNRILNNYVHGNGYRYLVDNYAVQRYKENMEKLIETVRNITSILISIFSIVQPNIFQSIDYRGAMECGYTPEEGCEYWVMKIIVEYMDKFFPKIHPELLQFLEDNNGYGMKMLKKHYIEK